MRYCRSIGPPTRLCCLGQKAFMHGAFVNARHRYTSLIFQYNFVVPHTLSFCE